MIVFLVICYFIIMLLNVYVYYSLRKRKYELINIIEKYNIHIYELFIVFRNIQCGIVLCSLIIFLLSMITIFAIIVDYVI